MSNPFSRSAIRREFPVEKIPAIVGANGRVNLRAITMIFSLNGCPNAKPAVAAALIKNGVDANTAIKVTMLAHYMDDSSVHCVERVTAAINHAVKEDNAARYPWGKEAEDRAARFEGRESRWGTCDFHSDAFANKNSIRTNYYPCAPFGPVAA